MPTELTENLGNSLDYLEETTALPCFYHLITGQNTIDIQDRYEKIALSLR
jgi:hypothetical protein